MVKKSEINEYCPELDMGDEEEQNKELSKHPRGIHVRRNAAMRAINRDRHAKRSFVISDTHLGHYNIIGYCDRPFETLEEMNETLIQNWNDAIKNNDTVYFLGDLAFGKAHTEETKIKIAPF